MAVRLQVAYKAFGAVLLCDIMLWLALWAGLLQSGWFNSRGLIGVWTFGALRGVLVHSLTLVALGGETLPMVKRWVALTCLLPPVFENGRSALGLGTQGALSPFPDPCVVLLSLASATLACLVWEGVVPDGKPERGDLEQKKKKQESRALLLRVVRYSRPDALVLASAFLFLGLAVICETCIPYYVGKVIDVLSSHYQHGSFKLAIEGMVLFSIGSSLCSGLRGGLFMCSLARLNKRIRHMLFQNLVRQEIHFFEENKPGSLTSRLVSDTDKMGRSVAMNANVLVRNLVKTLGLLGFMLSISWQLTLLICVEMPLVFLMQSTYNTYGQELTSQLQDCEADAKELAGSVVGAVRTVRSFRGGDQEVQRYNRTLEKMHKVQIRKRWFSVLFCFMKRMLTVSIKVAMLIQGRRLISSGHMSSGSLLAFVLYQKDMMSTVKQLVFVFGDMLNTVGAAGKVFQYLDRRPRQSEAGQLAPPKLEGKLELSNVTFSYPSRPDVAALKGVTLELRPGKMTALVGPSGGGKSSCVSLMKRLYEPQEGEVLLDGKPLHHYQHQYLHQKVVLVSQDPVLFSGSVKDNIVYGLQGCSMEKVIEASLKANAHDFISKLEHGYDTDIGECGGLLSAGQRQCIAIARALIRNPVILILDEAISSMDINTSHAMQAVLSGSPGQTVLVVAHRLQTVERADNIIFVENGTVVEEGTHKELMARRGRYHRLKEKLFIDLQ